MLRRAACGEREPADEPAALAPAPVTEEERRAEAEGRGCIPAEFGNYPDLVCRLHVNVTEEQAGAALDGRPDAIVRDGDQIVFFSLFDQDGAPFLCCSLQTAMERVGETNIWAARFRLTELDRGMITLVPPAQRSDAPLAEQLVVWRGPNAPPEPRSITEAALEGEIVERTLWSDHLQETRKFWIYLPPGYDPTRVYPALYQADGGMFPGVIEAAIADGAIPPIVVIGMLSGQEGIVEDRSELGIADLRSADYLPGFPDGGGRFDPHLAYLTDELIPWAEREFSLSPDSADRIITGWSNGGALAVWAALKRPGVFGAAMPMSQAYRPVNDNEPELAAGAGHTRFFFSAGYYEPAFYSGTQQSARALQNAGFDAYFTDYAAGHMLDQWQVALLRNLESYFSGRP